MIIIALAYYPFMIKIVFSQLKLQDYSDDNLMDRIDDKKLVEDSAYGDKSRSEPLQNFLLKQSNIVAGRAIFISGLAQQGIMRFMPSPAVYKESDHGANSFLVFVSFAMAFSYFSGNIFLIFQVFIPDTVKSKQLAFAIMIKPIANFLFFCYISGFIALFLGNIFVADGCAFEDLRRVSVSFGCVGLGLVLACMYQSAATDAVAVNACSGSSSGSSSSSGGDVVGTDVFSESSRDKHTSTSTTADTDTNTDREYPSTSTATATAAAADADAGKKKHLENIFAALNTAGSMSTFAAGYLFYNVITYESDVLRLPDNDDVGE
jgi:hypothetical protein